MKQPHEINGAQGRIRTSVALSAADLQSAAINHSATCAYVYSNLAHVGTPSGEGSDGSFDGQLILGFQQQARGRKSSSSPMLDCKESAIHCITSTARRV